MMGRFESIFWTIALAIVLIDSTLLIHYAYQIYTDYYTLHFGVHILVVALIGLGYAFFRWKLYANGGDV